MRGTERHAYTDNRRDCKMPSEVYNHTVWVCKMPSDVYSHSPQQHCMGLRLSHIHNPSITHAGHLEPINASHISL